jgi:hypothetical protein
VEAALAPELLGFMEAHFPPADLTAHRRELPITVDRARAAFASWYEFFPRSEGSTAGDARHLRRRRAPAAAPRRARLRRDLPAAHPPDRAHVPQGAQQQPHPRAERRRQPVGDRQRGRRARRRGSEPRHARRLRALRATVRGARDGRGARLRAPVRARPSVGEGSPRLVPHPSDGTIAYARTRRRSTRTSTRSTSGATTARGCGTPAATRSSSGASAACARSASTTRTPSRSRSGSGRSRRCGSASPTRCS